MSKKTNPYNWKTTEALRSATETFHRLTEVLKAKVDALTARLGSAEVDTGQLTKEIIAHQGAWKMVLDAQAKYKDDERDKEGVGKDGIDFAKAKEEVLGRISRLVARGRGREVS